MEKFKGTKGPWKVDTKFNQIQSIEGSTLVMSFGKSAKPEDKNLISAAPDLLEALQGLIVFIQSNGISIPADVSTAPIGIAKAAIAKALTNS